MAARRPPAAPIAWVKIDAGWLGHGLVHDYLLSRDRRGVSRLARWRRPVLGESRDVPDFAREVLDSAVPAVTFHLGKQAAQDLEDAGAVTPGG